MTLLARALELQRTRMHRQEQTSYAETAPWREPPIRPGEQPPVRGFAPLTAPVRQTRRRQRGTTVIEIAVVLPLLMFLMFGVFDFARMFYARLTMQHAVREAVRFAVTGNALNDPGTGTPQSRVDSIRSKILLNAVGLDVDVNSIAITPPDGGGPGQVVTVSTGFSYEFTTPLIKPLFPDGRYSFTVASSMKNEPFYTD